MTEPTLSDFVEAIRKSGWLTRGQVEEIAALASAADADPKAVAKEIVQRGWLTVFQVKMFWRGRSAELVLGQYVLLERLGEGGMGTVYKARHRRMDREVAIKVIRRERLENAETVSRFEREIRAAAQLTHENVVMAYDADQANGVHFFAMEYVEGTNLSALVREQGPLPIPQACDFIRQAALGLQHAHERGMVHRDIKPSNLLLSKSGAVKILDMGLARLHDGAGGELQTRITHEGLVLGTPDFLAPEQARNSHHADIRSDLYSLGCSLYFLLAGQPPYPGGTPTEKLVRHSVDPAPDVRLVRPDVSIPLAAVVLRLMGKRPEDRYQSPAELVSMLEPFCSKRLSSRIIAQHEPPKYVPIVQPMHHRPAPVPIAEPLTDSRFALPAPRNEAPLLPPPRTRRRWVKAAIGLTALAIAGGAVWAFSKRKH